MKVDSENLPDLNRTHSRTHPAGRRAASVGAQIRPFARTIIDIVFPQRCFVCGELIDAAGAICSVCWRELTFIASPLCDRCGYPFEHAVPDGTLCGACVISAPPFTSARSAIVYNDASRGLVLSFKHADRTRYAEAFGKWLARAGADCLTDADMIVPVPLHPWRLVRRRYNQSLLLARALSRNANCPVVPDLLVRLRNTPPQGRLSRRHRLKNVRNAFIVRSGRERCLMGKSIILVDDVLTTGATVEACSAVLTAAGASEIHILTLARVVRPQAL